MAHKAVIKPFSVLNATSVSGTNTYVQDQGGTAYTDVTYLDNVGYMLRVDSGTPSGSFTFEGSNDLTNWEDLGVSPAATVTSGVFASGRAYMLVSINQFPFAYIRVKYTNSSGTGTVSAIVTAKGI